jgi:hypothetical protein
LGTFSFLALFTVALSAVFLPKFWQTFRENLSLLGLLTIFILPYYFSGGDWLPNAWGRYLFPLVLFSVLLAIAAFSQAFQQTEGTARATFVAILLVAFSINREIPYGPTERVENYLFHGRRILGDLSFIKKRRMNYRTHYLSQMGNHLAATTRPNEVLATSEIATISYFARRETLDLLGIANPEIISQPLRPHPGFIQPAKFEMALPHLIFKRVNLDLIPKYMPDYIYMFDLISENILRHVPFEELNNKNVLLAYVRWKNLFRQLINTLYGGLDRIIGLGYQPFIVVYQDGFCSLYFVAPHAVKEHIQRLEENGLKGGRESALF